MDIRAGKFTGTHHVGLPVCHICISGELSCTSVVDVERELEYRVESGIGELQMPRMPPLGFVIWIPVCRIAEFSHGSGEIVLCDSRQSEGKRLPYRVE